MGVQLSRAPAPQPDPPPQPLPEPGTGEMRMIAACALRAQALRRAADQASPLQAERAVVEYGAAVALERAAHMWADGADSDAQRWMAAAQNSLSAALIPIPWNTR